MPLVGIMKTITNKVNMMNNLQTAVINQLGYDELDDDCRITLENICQYGIDGGFGSFVYYSDTVKFFDDNNQEILSYAQEMAECLGMDMLAMIASFKCLGSDYTATDIMEGIYEPDSEHETQVKNALAWFAAEEVARQLVDY